MTGMCCDGNQYCVGSSPSGDYYGPFGTTCSQIITNDECYVCGGDCIEFGVNCPDAFGGNEACDCFGNVDLGCGCNSQEDLGCGCDEPGPSGCDNVCGSTLENDECGACMDEDYVVPYYDAFGNPSPGWLYPSTHCCEENCEDYMDGSCSAVFCDVWRGGSWNDCDFGPNDCPGYTHDAHCRDATGTSRPECACKCSFNNNEEWAGLGAAEYTDCTSNDDCDHSPIDNWIPKNWPKLDGWNFVIPPRETSGQRFQVCLKNLDCNGGSCDITSDECYEGQGNNCHCYWDGISEYPCGGSSCGDICAADCPVQPSGQDEMCCTAYNDWYSSDTGGCKHNIVYSEQPNFVEVYGYCNGF
jgi:hypothetical protein